MAPRPRIRTWRPDVPGVAEVLHAHFPSHAYPPHTHDTWTVLLVDHGTVRYDLGRHERATARSRVTVLPPYVAHDGRSAEAGGFRKRVLYLDADRLDPERVGSWVDRPDPADGALRAAVDRLHRAVALPGEELAAEVGLALVVERLQRHLARVDPEAPPVTAPTLARRLRELLDERMVEGVSLAEAAAELGADPAHLVRVFRREVGVPPHRYLVGRRLDAARHALLAGHPPAEVAVQVGFHDQSHLHRHFRRLLGVTPGEYVRSLNPGR
ncbi:AraC family transcriptional regulator [Nocardioides humi]|uniref:AraC family transcriptional regulator n=1 Tax=Nocardioides humi TaxID=449461 RepID=A0ABN1ZPL8_9ACTN|nr:helix-turn-helix domain-containing protein [Nocardioides humi]